MIGMMARHSSLNSSDAHGITVVMVAPE